MCGRYASSRKPEDLVELFGVESWEPAGGPAPDWNIAPTKSVWAVLEHSPQDGAPPLRRLQALRWGLVPSWSRTPGSGAKMINARAETVHERPAYRRAFASRRCLLPADGYYEWTAPGAGRAAGPGRSGRKQPCFITPADGSVMAMAGIYEFWHDRTRPQDDPSAWWATCAVITTEAEDGLGRLHPRMPLLIEPGAYDAWLDPACGDPERLRGLLVPPRPGRLEVRPVSPAVNSVRSNGPELTARVEVRDEPEPTPRAGARDEGVLF